VRLAGKDRYATSWKIADVFFVGADTAILARGDDFADALSAGALAYSLHAPILLVDKFENHGMARNFVFGSWAQVTNVYVMGGEGAISDKVVQWVIDPSLY
jgi:putative cell wall-binding protein